MGYQIWLGLGVSLLAAAAVLVSTRSGMLMSPDSMTYLATANNLHRHGRFTDFTGQPMTVFGPVYPLLLAWGGTSLGWARFVAAVAFATATLAMYWLLVRRVAIASAVLGATAFGLSIGLLRVASTVWSEIPYVALSLITLLALFARPLQTRWIFVAGVCAGLGFLTRYAGIGLIVTGLVVMACQCRGVGRSVSIRRFAVFSLGSTAMCALWVLRNLVVANQPLGPRFEGGTSDSMGILIRRPLGAIGEAVWGSAQPKSTAELIGFGAIVGLFVAAGFGFRRWNATGEVADFGVAVYGLTSIVVPVLARAITANDIESRVMSPTIVPIAYVLVVVADRMRNRRVGAAAGLCAAVAWSGLGLRLTNDFPARLSASAGSRSSFSSEMYDAVDALPKNAIVMTNSPQRVWWQSRREPVLFAFTRPRPGNSHYPLNAAETLRYACAGNAYLAWFDDLQNAGDGPAERRPDLTAIVELAPVSNLRGATMYHLEPRSASSCP